MTIDFPREDQIPALSALWQEAFGDDAEVWNNFLETAFSEKRCRCLTWEGNLVSALYWFDCTYQGKKIAYLYAIATDKAYRGRGMCHRLMEDTHRYLQSCGYAAAVLVPDGEKLFGLYETMGYKPFCMRQETEILCDKVPVPLTPLTGAQYQKKLPQFLPQNSISMADYGFSYLETFAQFYETPGAIFCVSCWERQTVFQEFLGDVRLLPGVLSALSVPCAKVPLPGGKDYAMYLPLEAVDLTEAYFGLPMG